VTLAERDREWFAAGWRDQPPTGMAFCEITVFSASLPVTEAIRIAHAFLDVVHA
jgi:hypothetical protein